MAIFGIQCKEDWFPGMWQRWYKAQCAAVGWPLQKLDGPADRGWRQCRNRLKEMMPGDWIVVQLKGRRIGLIRLCRRRDFRPRHYCFLADDTRVCVGEFASERRVRTVHHGWIGNAFGLRNNADNGSGSRQLGWHGGHTNHQHTARDSDCSLWWLVLLAPLKS